MSHPWWLIINERSESWTSFEIKRMFNQPDNRSSRLHACKWFWSRSGIGISNVMYIEIHHQIMIPIERWEAGMRIAKGLFQDFLICVDAVSSIIFIMIMNAICILTTELKRKYQNSIQGRLNIREYSQPMIHRLWIIKFKKYGGATEFKF